MLEIASLPGLVPSYSEYLGGSSHGNLMLTSRKKQCIVSQIVAVTPLLSVDDNRKEVLQVLISSRKLSTYL